MTDRQRWALAVGALWATPEVVRIPGTNDDRDRKTLLLKIGNDIKTAQAYYLARAVVLAAGAAHSGLVTVDEAWHVILFAAGVAQRRYRSWRELGLAYEDELDGISDGRAYAKGKTDRALADPAHPWCTLPWDLDLGETYLAP